MRLLEFEAKARLARHGIVVPSGALWPSFPEGATRYVVKAQVPEGGRGKRGAVVVDKDIPVAGGMAGGSADAAGALVALDRLWSLDTSDEDLLRLAAELGSDVPFALVGGSAHGTGRGEIVHRVADGGAWWWVVVPAREGLSTPAVYRRFDELRPDAPPEE